MCWLGGVGVSVRQGRRYVEVATRSGSMAVPGERAVFTVKVPVTVAQRVREYARLSGRSISAVVTQALEEFLQRARRNHSRR